MRGLDHGTACDSYWVKQQLGVGTGLLEVGAGVLDVDWGVYWVASYSGLRPLLKTRIRPTSPPTPRKHQWKNPLPSNRSQHLKRATLPKPRPTSTSHHKPRTLLASQQANQASAWAIPQGPRETCHRIAATTLAWEGVRFAKRPCWVATPITARMGIWTKLAQEAYCYHSWSDEINDWGFPKLAPQISGHLVIPNHWRFFIAWVWSLVNRKLALTKRVPTRLVGIVPRHSAKTRNHHTSQSHRTRTIAAKTLAWKIMLASPLASLHFGGDEIVWC